MTAFMAASIACFVYAYKRNKSFLPFGIFFGLALFTKQPSVLILVIIAVWLLLINEKRVLLKLVVPIVVGAFPILIYIVYHTLSGNVQGVLQLVYGEAVHRTALFSNWKNTLAGLVVGVSPLILILALYAVYRSKNIRNVLVIWLFVYGIFVLARTPPSHEYYILPLTPPFAILSAGGVLYLKETRYRVLAIALLIISAISVSYVFLSYTGDLGYTCTKDVIENLPLYPNENAIIITPNRYAPQLEWYSELRGLDAKVVSITDDLSSVSLADIKDFEKMEAKKIFLVIDGRGGLEEKLNIAGLRCIYKSHYNTTLPNLFASIYTGEKIGKQCFEQHLSVYELK